MTVNGYLYQGMHQLQYMALFVPSQRRVGAPTKSASTRASSFECQCIITRHDFDLSLAIIFGLRAP